MPERPLPRPHARLFLALWPDAAARAALVAWQHAWHWPPGVARVVPQRLHLTLHFIGDVDESRLDALGSALALPFEPFELAFGTPQQWHGGLALAVPDAVPEGLLGLHARLGDALRTQEGAGGGARFQAASDAGASRRGRAAAGRPAVLPLDGLGATRWCARPAATAPCANTAATPAGPLPREGAS
ncbi:MAG: RNA 2',3'-cyclic phosphodiesterase [Comamonadaceae bacterium]|nr:RNA 2',3'-cyclic phosphodiesterase [Comamonadaceae bacterium]